MSDSDSRVSIEDDLQGLNMNQNQTHVPFILRLPTELASEIFLFCLEPLSAKEVSESYRSHWYKVTAGLTPSEIVSVCKSWREIALSTPQLWCRIRVSLRSCYSPYHTFLEDLLSRSGSLPLSFILADEQRMKCGTTAKAVINLLNQHSARWHSLVLLVSPFHMSGLRGNPNAFSNLVIKAPPSYDRDWCRAYPPEVPVLHLDGKFSLSDTSPPAPYCVFIEEEAVSMLSFDCLHISWVNAAIITLGAIYTTEFNYLLSSTPRLEELTVSIRPGYGDSENNVWSMVSNSSLKRLTIELDTTDESWGHFPSIDNIFSWITLPSIEQLILRDFCSGLQSLSEFVSRSSCDLKSLHLSSCNGSYAENIAELRQIPSISCLELAYTKLDMEGAGDFLRELAHTKSYEKTGIPSNMLLPNLRSLGMKVEQSVKWSLVPGIILPLPEQQSTIFQCRPLTDLIIWIHRHRRHSPSHDDANKAYIPLDVLNELQNFRDRGYNLSIRYQDGQDFMQASRIYHAGQRLERAETGRFGGSDEEDD